MSRKKSTLSNNIEAQNRLAGGILGMIPATLVGGALGAVVSLAAGILGVNHSLNKANKNYNPYRRSIREIASDEYKAHMERQKNGEKYANMTSEDCDRYFANFRKKYPMVDHIYGYNLDTGYAPTTLGCYEILGQMGDDTHRDIAPRVLIENDIIRKLEGAIKKGEEDIGWYKYEHRKYYDVLYPEEGYYVAGYSYAYKIGMYTFFPINECKACREANTLYDGRWI